MLLNEVAYRVVYIQPETVDEIAMINSKPRRKDWRPDQSQSFHIIHTS